MKRGERDADMAFDMTFGAPLDSSFGELRADVRAPTPMPSNGAN